MAPWLAAQARVVELPVVWAAPPLVPRMVPLPGLRMMLRMMPRTLVSRTPLRLLAQPLREPREPSPLRARPLVVLPFSLFPTFPRSKPLSERLLSACAVASETSAQ
jgi:hypothetical protein